MEILSQSIKKIVSDDLKEFQKNILKIIISTLYKLSHENISKDSFIDYGAFIDFILKSAKNDFILTLSMRKQCFYINSNYFDIYIYPEDCTKEIERLVEDIILGRISFCFNTSIES